MTFLIKDINVSSNYTINNILKEKYNKWNSETSFFLKYDKNNDDFVSLFEIMKNFNIISEHKRLTQNSPFKVLYICNSVSQIIHSIKYILDTKYQTIKDYDWRMIIPNIPSSNLNLINNYSKLLGGSDNTGDITNINNIKWYSNSFNIIVKYRICQYIQIFTFFTIFALTRFICFKVFYYVC